MIIEIPTGWAIAIGILIGIFCTYVILKIRLIELNMNNFPTPDELAREIVKIKLPLSELPQDVQNQIEAEGEAFKKLQQPKLQERPNYVG